MCQENKKVCCLYDNTGCFVLEDALSIQKDTCTCSASLPFVYFRCIARLDKLGQTFVVPLVMRL